MDVLARLLGAQAVRTTAIVGSGGKTTLLWYLAAALGSLPAHRVLLTTTTKIGMPPSAAGYGRTAFLPEHAPAAAQAAFLAQTLLPAAPGVTLAGTIAKTTPKLSALPPQLLEAAAKAYTHTLFEADGAHMRPLKGWAAHEPVVPAWTARTVGVIPLWPLGHAADETVIHRFPQFQALTGVRQGEPLAPAHLAAAIAAPNGLFAKAQGENVLFFSAWQPGDAARARDVLRRLPQAFQARLALAVAGDAKAGTGEVLLQNNGKEGGQWNP